MLVLVLGLGYRVQVFRWSCLRLLVLGQGFTVSGSGCKGVKNFGCQSLGFRVGGFGRRGSAEKSCTHIYRSIIGIRVLPSGPILGAQGSSIKRLQSRPEATLEILHTFGLGFRV